MTKPQISLLASVRNRAGHIPSLDGLRHQHHTRHPAALCLRPVSWWAWRDGLFFSFSGFLIARLLIAEQDRTGRISFGGFYLRRFFRLYPVLILYGVVVVATGLLQGRNINWTEPLSALFYFFNFHYSTLQQVEIPGVWLPFEISWSMSIEEHFYLFFPLVVLLVPARKWLMAGVVATIIAALRLALPLVLVEGLRLLCLSRHVLLDPPVLSRTRRRNGK